MQKSLFRPLFRTFLHFLTSGNTSLVISIAKFEFSCKKTQVIFLASNDPRIWECHVWWYVGCEGFFWFGELSKRVNRNKVEEQLNPKLVRWRIHKMYFLRFWQFKKWPSKWSSESMLIAKVFSVESKKGMALTHKIEEKRTQSFLDVTY